VLFYLEEFSVLIAISKIIWLYFKPDVV